MWMGSGSHLPPATQVTGWTKLGCRYRHTLNSTGTFLKHCCITIAIFAKLKSKKKTFFDLKSFRILSVSTYKPITSKIGSKPLRPSFERYRGVDGRPRSVVVQLRALLPQQCLRKSEKCKITCRSRKQIPPRHFCWQW